MDNKEKEIQELREKVRKASLPEKLDLAEELADLLAGEDRYDPKKKFWD